MAISFVGGNSAATAGSTDVSVSLTALTGGSDSAAATGDLVIFAFNIADADNVDLNLVMVTTGYTEVADLFGNGTQDANLGVFYKFMSATPDTTAVGEGSTGGTDTAIPAAVMVFRGVKTVADGGPFDVTRTTATGTTGGLPDPPSIDTTGAAGIWTVIVGANAHIAGAGGVFTGPTNYTTDFITISGPNDTADGILGMGYRTNPADPENPGAFADNVAATGWCAVTMALSVGASPVTVTPGVASLTTARFAPTVSTPRLVTPAIATLTTSSFAPGITVGITVIPDAATLVTSLFTPTVNTPRLVTPGIAALVVSPFAPIVAIPRLVTTGIAELLLSSFAPSIITPRLVTPSTANLTTATFAPSLAVGLRLTPAMVQLLLSTFAPTVTGTGGGAQQGTSVHPKLGFTDFVRDAQNIHPKMS